MRTTTVITEPGDRQLRGRGTHVLIPADDHAPLKQRMVLTERADAVAEQFYRYVQEPAARATLARYGFAPPE